LFNCFDIFFTLSFVDVPGGTAIAPRRLVVSSFETYFSISVFPLLGDCLLVLLPLIFIYKKYKKIIKIINLIRPNKKNAD
jgi:hypothetical protein